MKALIILSVVQVGLLILLFSRITALDNRVAALPPTSPAAPVSDSFPSSPADGHPDDVFSSNDYARLRQIIREELRAHPAPGATDDQLATETRTFNAGTTPDTRIELNRVSQKIDYYSSVGHISAIEMGTLEMEIAKLDPAGRRAMLRRLTQALNSGAIEGRF